MSHRETVPQNHEGDFRIPAQPPESMSLSLAQSDAALNGLSMTLGEPPNISRLTGANLAAKLQNLNPLGRKPFGNNVPVTFSGGNVSEKRVSEEALQLATANPEQTTQFYTDT